MVSRITLPAGTARAGQSKAAVREMFDVLFAPHVSKCWWTKTVYSVDDRRLHDRHVAGGALRSDEHSDRSVDISPVEPILRLCVLPGYPVLDMSGHVRLS